MRKYLLHVLIISSLIHTLTGCDSSLREKQAKEIEAYKQAIRINPDDAEAHYNLGVAYISLKDKASALEQYKILKSLNLEKARELFILIIE